MRIIPLIMALAFIAATVRSVLPVLASACGLDACAPEACVVVCESTCSGLYQEENVDHQGSNGLPESPDNNCCLPLVCCYCCCYYEQIRQFALYLPVVTSTSPGYSEGLIPRKFDIEVFHPPEFVLT